MQHFALPSRIMAGIVISLFCISSGLLIPVVTGADVEIEAYMGETITLHGFSYIGDSVYLFLTGPGLPENGVTLTDISQRADQGHFTIVRLNDNQEWTYIWKTSRIHTEIDPGTYVVYVTNEPADLAHLGGPSSYKTLSVFLKDSGDSKVSIGGGQSYTLNPEEDNSTPVPAPSINITSTTPAATSATPSPTVLVTSLPTTVPTTRADAGPLAVVTAFVSCVVLIASRKVRP
jgi:hypothetical protein